MVVNLKPTVKTYSDRAIRCDIQQSMVLDILEGCKAGFATFHNYESTTGYLKDRPKVSTITVNSMVRPQKVYANEVDALEEITLEEVAALLPDWKPFEGRKNDNNRATLAEQFDRCKEMMIQRQLGNGSEQHVKAHDDNSFSPIQGVKVWLNDDADENGIRSVKSILVFGLKVSETVHDKGERKPNNAGSKVQVDQAIEKLWNRKRCSLITLNPLKAELVTISGTAI